MNIDRIFLDKDRIIFCDDRNIMNNDRITKNRKVVDQAVGSDCSQNGIINGKIHIGMHSLAGELFKGK